MNFFVENGVASEKIFYPLDCLVIRASHELQHWVAITLKSLDCFVICES
jgi:hypothetical protein